MNTSPRTPARPGMTRAALAAAALIALLAAAFAFSPLAQAQEGTEYDYVDLLMLYEQGPAGSGNANKVAYSVRNIGTATATGVTVSFLLENLDLGPFTDSPTFPDTKMDNTTKQTTFTWEVGTILPGESSEITFATGLHDAHSSANRIGVINATAKALQPEPGILSANNIIKFYSFAARDSGATPHMKGNKLALLLSVDDLEPAAGDDLNFDLTARNFNESGAGSSSFINLIGDIEIKVELSRGLKFKAGWSPTGVTVASDRQSATWKPEAVDTRADVGTQIRPISRELADIETQLTTDTLDDIPLEERCITAWVADSTPPPVADYALGSLKQCLGDDPTVLFQSGRIDLFTVYPCAGTSTIIYPCRDDNSDSTADNGLELVATVNSVDHPVLRAYGVGRSDTATSVRLRPETVVIHIKDTEGRIDDSGSVSWEITASGIDPYIDNRLLVGTDVWTRIKWVIASVGLPSSGIMTIGPESTRTAKWLDTTSQTSYGPYDNTPPDNWIQYFINADFHAYIKFNKLGTYAIKFTQENTHATHGALTATGQYIFHVGPVAELEVRDGGANLEVPANQRAYTIIAVNNGPDAAPAAKVTLPGLDAGSCAGNATKGSIAFANGECTWTIGELIAKNASQPTTGREGEVLTISTSAAVDTEITATISNTQDYQVCIDSSGDDVDLSSPSSSACTTENAANTWHTTDYYDYISDNDSASIASRPGIRGVFTLTVMEEADEVTLRWPAQTTLTDGSEVTHYGLLVSGDGGNTWRTLTSRVEGTSLSAPTGALPFGNTRHYAVYAQNRQGDRDLPFATAVVEDVVVRTNTVTRTETVEVEVEVIKEVLVAAPPPQISVPAVVITPLGQPQVGEELTARIQSAVPYRWLWLRSAAGGPWQIIEGATHPTYVPTEQDAGSRLQVVVQHSSGVTGAMTPPLAGTPPPAPRDAAAASVTIEPGGQPQVGTELTATLENGIYPTWQWQRSATGGLWLNIAGATGPAYTPTEQDAGRRLRVIAVYGRPGGEYGVAGAVTPALAGQPAAAALTEVSAGFDTNGDGRIGLDEVLAVITAYFNWELDYDVVLEVISAYYAG